MIYVLPRRAALLLGAHIPVEKEDNLLDKRCSYFHGVLAVTAGMVSVFWLGRVAGVRRRCKDG